MTIKCYIYIIFLWIIFGYYMLISHCIWCYYVCQISFFWVVIFVLMYKKLVLYVFFYWIFFVLVLNFSICVINIRFEDCVVRVIFECLLFCVFFQFCIFFVIWRELSLSCWSCVIFWYCYLIFWWVCCVNLIE